MSAGKSEVAVAYLAEDDNCAFVFHASNHRFLEEYTERGFVITPLVPESLLLDARAEVERLEAELAGSTAQAERMMAYMITHNGAALYCSDAMRDAYSEEHHGRLRAEALAGELQKDADRYRYLAENSDRISTTHFDWEWEVHEYGVRDSSLDTAIDAVGGRGKP